MPKFTLRCEIEICSAEIVKANKTAIELLEKTNSVAIVSGDAVTIKSYVVLPSQDLNKK